MAKAFFRPHESLAQVREMRATQVFQLPAFEQVPDALLRVEVRSIAGKTLQMESLGRTTSEKLLDDLGAVDGEPSQITRSLRNNRRKNATTSCAQ